MTEKIIQMVDAYWKFDDNQEPVSNWHDKQDLLKTLEVSLQPAVIWRCIKDITNIYGENIFTKGLVYEQIKTKKYPMMLIDNKIEESEVSNFGDYFTSITKLINNTKN